MTTLLATNNPNRFCLYNSAAFTAFAYRNNTLIVSTDINPDDDTKKSLKNYLIKHMEQLLI